VVVVGGNEIRYSSSIYLSCPRCRRVYEYNLWLFFCLECREPLEVKLALSRNSIQLREVHSMWRYLDLLPVPPGVKPITMGEGLTPLVELRNIGRTLGLENLYIKLESTNPTGSFKDRGVSLAVTLANYYRCRRYIVASTGNTAASAAAYTARVDGRCIVVLPRGGVAGGKLLQAVLHGAIVVEVEGSFDDALQIVVRAAEEELVYPLNSFNPVRLEGQKTISYELWEQLGREPDWVVVPVGNAGNISAIGKGFRELRDIGFIDEVPKLVGVQAAGASPIATAWRMGEKKLPVITKPRTIASAIRIARPINWFKAWREVEESGGSFVEVDDESIISAQLELARREGIGVEPASAAALAGLKKVVESGVIDRRDVVVVVATGHSLKDPSVQEIAEEKTTRVVLEGKSIDVLLDSLVEIH